MRDRHPTWDEILSPEDPDVFLDDGPGTGIDGRYGPEIRDLDDEDSAFPSEMDRVLEQVEEAQHTPDGRPLGQIDQAFQLRELERAEENRVAPHVCPIPASWDRGVLGNTLTISPGSPTTDPGPLQQLVHWPGDARETQAVTVTVQPAPPYPTANVASAVLRPFARVRWGTHGASFEVDVDCGYGAMLTLNASSVYVSVGMEATTTLSWSVSGSIGFFASHPSLPPRRTVYIDALGASATQRVDRPRFANTVQVERVANVAMTLSFLDIAGTTIYARFLSATLSTTVNEQPSALSNDVVAINVRNDDASARNVRVIFGLSV